MACTGVVEKTRIVGVEQTSHLNTLAGREQEVPSLQSPAGEAEEIKYPVTSNQAEKQKKSSVISLQSPAGKAMPLPERVYQMSGGSPSSDPFSVRSMSAVATDYGLRLLLSDWRLKTGDW